MKPKVRETLNQIIERFESGDIPEAVAYSMFPNQLNTDGRPSRRQSVAEAEAHSGNRWKKIKKNIKKTKTYYHVLL